MKLDLNIDVRHLTRVEGHGNIRVRVRGGKVEEARWDVVETPRFMEVLMRGRPFTQAPVLASRICGICSISHALASLRAVERGLGISPPETARKLRDLAHRGELLQSHVLHLLFLAAPDFLGEPDVTPLIQKSPAVVQIALRLKGLGNRICEVVAGRTTHPVSFRVGGMSRMPDRDALLRLGDDLERSLEDLGAVADLVAAFDIPDFSRETEYVSLKGTDVYPFIGGDLVSTDGVEKAEDDYASMTNEYVVEAGTSKWTRLSRDSYAVGALARVNNNASRLHPEAAKVASRLGLKPVCHNPFLNNVAQLVECVHVVHEAIGLIQDLTGTPAGDLRTEAKPREGSGIGALEAPRGLLVHHYELDGRGEIRKANCVVPTTQNNANIHLDLGELVGKYAKKGMTDENLELLCSKLVRAYDPCLSCSVH